MNPQPSRSKRVVIVGGGFGGLYAAKALANRGVRVTLIDRKNHHTFQPLLYQVAAGVLSPSQIAAPLRHILRKARNVEVLLGEVVGFDLDRRCVRIDSGNEIGYDRLIVAAGARESYFGHDEWAQDAPGLKTLDDATDLRRRILLAFEQAEREALLTGKHRPLVFSVVGAGPTGVELAGAIADIARRVVADDFRAIDTRKARVVLFEGGPRVLPAYAEELSARAMAQLEEIGVKVHLNRMVTGVEPGRILADGEWVPASVVLWASGVAASPLGKLLGAPTDRAGRIAVEADLSLPGRPEVFVVGDMASRPGVPGLAAAAMQMGRSAARNVLHDRREPFRYRDKGTMATIGKHRAIAQLGPLRLAGFVAWYLWLFVHVTLLMGYRRRLGVMREWVWAYLTNQFNVRLITGDGPERLSPSPGTVSIRSEDDTLLTRRTGRP